MFTWAVWFQSQWLPHPTIVHLSLIHSILSQSHAMTSGWSLRGDWQLLRTTLQCQNQRGISVTSSTLPFLLFLRIPICVFPYIHAPNVWAFSYFFSTHLNFIMGLRILEVQGRANGIFCFVCEYVQDIRRKEQINKTKTPVFILLAETQTLGLQVLHWRFIDDKQKPRDWQLKSVLVTSDGLKGHLTQQQPVKQEPLPDQIKKRTTLCRIKKGSFRVCQKAES